MDSKRSHRVRSRYTMKTSMTPHTTAVLGGVLIALGLTATPAQQTTQSSELSARLERAALAPPLEFAMMLAQAGVPSGVVLGESESRSPTGGPPDPHLPRGAVTSVEVLARAFNASHSTIAPSCWGTSLSYIAALRCLSCSCDAVAAAKARSSELCRPFVSRGQAWTLSCVPPVMAF